MSLDTIKTTFERVFASPYAASQITVIWHAGEPLVLPVTYYESAFQAAASLLSDKNEILQATWE